MIKFRCDGCGKKIGAPESYAGRQVACPSCKQPATVPSAAPADADHDDLMPDLDELEPAGHGAAQPASAAAATGRTCPKCHKPVAASAVLCVNCGEPLTGSMKRPRTRAAGGGSFARSAAGLLVAGIVAVVFSLVWVGIVVGTGYELGILAWAIGGVIGLTAGAIARNPSPVFGGLTATLALGSILAAKFIVVGIFMGLSALTGFMSGVMSFDPEVQKAHHAVLEEMIAEGALAGDELATAQEQVDLYFGVETVADTEVPVEADFSATDWEAEMAAAAALQQKVSERLATMSEEQTAAAIQRARERHPEWIEDPSVYVAAIDDLVHRGALPDDLRRHAQNDVTSMLGDTYDNEYYQTTTPRELQRRSEALRERAIAEIRNLSQEQRQALVEATRQRNPHWIADPQLHYAVLDQMVQEGSLSGDVLEVARADVASTMDMEWEQEAFEKHDWEALSALRDQATAAANQRITGMSADERAQAIEQAQAAHPMWDNPLGAATQELDNALAQANIDGSLGSAMAAAFGWFDLLWGVLAVSTAYSVAVKQGQKAAA